VSERIGASISYFYAHNKIMEPNTKRPKKKAKKAVAEEQPAAPATQNIPTGGYLWSRDEEELVDY
jgi:hypothetical protein